MGILNSQAYAQSQFPKEDTHWDPNDDRDYQQLEQYQEALLRYEGWRKKGQEHEQNIRSLPMTR
jgi:Tfp pilus assembly protein PilP